MGSKKEEENVHSFHSNMWCIKDGCAVVSCYFRKSRNINSCVTNLKIKTAPVLPAKERRQKEKKSSSVMWVLCGTYTKGGCIIVVYSFKKIWRILMDWDWLPDCRVINLERKEYRSKFQGLAPLCVGLMKCAPCSILYWSWSWYRSISLEDEGWHKLCLVQAAFCHCNSHMKMYCLVDAASFVPSASVLIPELFLNCKWRKPIFSLD